jgi:hypothetical protein
MPVMLDRNNRNLEGSDPETVATALAALRSLIQSKVNQKPPEL